MDIRVRHRVNGINVVSKRYDENLNIPEAEAIRDKWERTTLPNGWYFIDTTHQKMQLLYWGESWIVKPTLKARFYDQFLVIDGKRIDFLEHLPKHTWNLYSENVAATSEHGAGLKYTFECKSRFMERNFYIAAEEIFYEKNMK